MTTPILGLTEVANAQSQPHVPINAATRALEVFAQICAITIGDTAPPGTQAEGDVYIVGDGATGDWAGHDWEVAYYSGGWLFLTPREGWKAFVVYDSTTYRYNGDSPVPWINDGTGGAIDATDVTYDGTATVADMIALFDEVILELLDTGIPYAQPGQPGDAAVYNVMIPVPLTIPAGLSRTHGYAGTNATSDADYLLSKNGAAAFGTIRFEGGGGVTLIAASSATFVPGDRLTITAPTPQDATLADVGFTIYARRT